MGKVKKNMILMRSEHLKVGTVFKTINRFKPDTNWEICKITELDIERNTAYLEILDRGAATNQNMIGKTIFTNPSCHIKHSNTAWIDYYLPGGSVLYSRKK